MKTYNTDADVSAIMAAAEQADPGTKYMLTTTLNRYQTLLMLLQRLQADIQTRGIKLMVGGQYQSNPSVSEYAKVSNAANTAVKSLLTIVRSMDDRPDMEKLAYDPDEEL